MAEDTATAPLPPSNTRWSRFAQPTELIERTRWLFCLCALLALLLTAVPALATGNATTLTLALTAAVVLCSSCVYQYQAREVPLVLDLLGAVAAMAFALGSSTPEVAFGFAFSSLWFRALYGSTRRVLLYCALMAVGIVSSLLLWGLIPGHAATTPAAPVLGPLPVLFLTVGVARHLALGLFLREQSQRRDSALALLGSQLLGLTDRAKILERAWQTATAICTATPGLRILVAVGAGDSLSVLGQAGGFSHVPATLSRSARLVPGQMVSLPATAFPALVVDSSSDWLAIPLPRRPDAWMLVSALHRIPADGLVAVQSMINQVALAERNSEIHRELEAQAKTDALTGLMNQAGFKIALELELANQDAGLVLIFLDLDDFKEVNDRLGHAAGDRLLRSVAARMGQAVRPGDLCARLGGDEFAILLRVRPEGSLAPLPTVIAERLVDLIAAPITLDDGESVQVGVSIGLAYASAAMSAEKLLQQADIAMYAAKAAGKCRVQTFDPALLPRQRQAHRAPNPVRPRP